MIIAIDGPSGAGKSTVAKAVAKEMDFSCLDTGAMFRCVAWQAAQLGVSLENAEELTRIASEYAISFEHEAGDPAPKRVLMGGVDVTAAIRTAETDRAVSAVASVPGVRAALLEQQRRIGNAGDYVVEGRDIGTVVFPQAAVKVFLTASNEERARRRVAQNQLRGVGSTDYEEVLASIIARDEADSSRAAAPLRAAEDAVHIDSTAFTIDQVIDQICQLGATARAAE